MTGTSTVRHFGRASFTTQEAADRERQREDPRAALQEMTKDASEAGLYGDTAQDYASALKAARKRIARQEEAT